MLRLLLASLVALASTTPAPARTINITVDNSMKFSVASISARPGETLHVVLKSTGTMPKLAMAHNFVLLQAGTDAEAFANAGMTARETNFIAPDQKAHVIASTTLVGPGETAEVTFTAPAKPGTYPFLCTFPGHFALGMKGTLVVK